MRKLEQRKIEDDAQLDKRIDPSKRRQLFEAAKYRDKEYKELKKQRLSIIKKERIINNSYPDGILGVDSPEREDMSLNY